MKNLKLFLLIFLALTLTQTAFSQRKLGGKVVEIVDGKTVVIQVPTGGRITVLLQFIEIPEREQPLYQTVKEHLQALILDKYVEFRLRGLMQNASPSQVFLNGIDISQQMLRDGAAWYNLPEKDSQNLDERQMYLEMENAAKTEKRGVWSVEGLKPSWEFRAEQEKKRKEQEEAALKQQQINTAAQDTSPKTVSKPIAIPVILPDKIPNTTYIDANGEIPKGFVVVGIGYLTGNSEKLIKAIKKPQDGDIVCVGQAIPLTFVITTYALSNFCPMTYGNNAQYIVNASNYSKAVTKTVIHRIILAFRMYRISGNYEEFEVKARDAVNETNQSLPFIQEGKLKENIMKASEAITDAMLVRNSRNGNYGARLSGSALIALNDKYGLNDVSAYSLDREIINEGISYINDAIKEAKQTGIL